MKNKAAVVTGGTKGIGLAVARALLRVGVRVFVCARNDREIMDVCDELGALGTIKGAVCDMRSDAQVKAMIESCVAEFGGIDILVNNAGMGIFGKTVEEITPEEFRQTLETNLMGVFYACHYAVPVMKAGSGGYIFNISSLAGQNAHPRMAAYNASKFALNGFTESLMLEVRHDDIKVSLICPGSVNTSFGGDQVSDEKAWQLQPDDIARVVVDLINHDPRSLPSKIEIRPSRPPRG